MTHVIIVPHSSSLLWQATMITSPDTQFSNVIPSQLQRSPPSSTAAVGGNEESIGKSG